LDKKETKKKKNLKVEQSAPEENMHLDCQDNHKWGVFGGGNCGSPESGGGGNKNIFKKNKKKEK